jgi:hypothetical protein
MRIFVLPQPWPEQRRQNLGSLQFPRHPADDKPDT